MQKGGTVTEIVTYGNSMEDSSDEENKKNKDQKKQLTNRGTLQMQCHLQELIANSQNEGYLLKIEKLQNHPGAGDTSQNQTLGIPLKKIASNFQFKFNVNKLVFNGEYIEPF